jgi:hypothetical protein
MNGCERSSIVCLKALSWNLHQDNQKNREKPQPSLLASSPMLDRAEYFEKNFKLPFYD